MEIFSPDFTRPAMYYLLAGVATVVCVVVTVITWSKPKWNRLVSTTSAAVLSGACSCPCSRGTDSESAQPEKQNGGTSMFELLKFGHLLSYLDYSSLCKLSMTNSLMRKAANDDNVWKALYHKDFWLEQDSLTPAKGWKAYYASTMEIMNVIEKFHKIMSTWDMSLMGQMWLNADYVKNIENSNFDSGYDAVMQNGWASAPNPVVEIVEIQGREVRVRVTEDIAWVTGKYFIGAGVDPNNYHLTSYVFEYHNGGWYMVWSHSTSSY